MCFHIFTDFTFKIVESVHIILMHYSLDKKTNGILLEAEGNSDIQSFLSSIAPSTISLKDSSFHNIIGSAINNFLSLSIFREVE